jgi:hypothetical protein
VILLVRHLKYNTLSTIFFSTSFLLNCEGWKGSGVITQDRGQMGSNDQDLWLSKPCAGVCDLSENDRFISFILNLNLWPTRLPKVHKKSWTVTRVAQAFLPSLQPTNTPPTLKDEEPLVVMPPRAPIVLSGGLDNDDCERPSRRRAIVDPRPVVLASMSSTSTATSSRSGPSPSYRDDDDIDARTTGLGSTTAR